MNGDLTVDTSLLSTEGTWPVACFVGHMVHKNLCRLIPAIISFLICLAGASQAATPERPTLYLRVGQRYPLEGIDAQDAKIIPENIARVRQTTEGFLIEALESGSAKLTMTTDKRRLEINVQVKGVTVAAQKPLDPLNFNGLPGAKLSNLRGKLLIQGEILGRQVYQKLLLLLRNQASGVVVLALPSPGIRESLIEQANTLLANRGLMTVTVTNAGHRFFLEGTVTRPEDVDLAYETVQNVLPNIENHIPLPLSLAPTVLIKVFILELSRQAHETLGLSWPSHTLNAAVFTPQAMLFNPSWAVSIHHLSARGQARVLAEPSLAVKLGSHAELSAGGEIPIRTTGRYENKVVWKRYGLSVKLHVIGTTGKHLRTKIETESSQLDSATAVDGVPGLRTNNMSTEIDAPVGQPILLTGLFQAGSAKDVEKLPLIGDIPLIGELFKSRRFIEHDSELLVALLPSLGSVETKIPLESLRGLNFDDKWRPID